MRGLDPGEVDLAGRQRRELGRGLVHDDDNEPVERRRPAQPAREIGVGSEHPAAAGLVGDEAERAVPDRLLVPHRAPQLGVGNRIEQAGGQDREIGEHIRHDVLRVIEPHHNRRVVRVVDERHVGEVVHTRVPGRRVARGRERPGDVARGRGNAVVPAHAGLQSERDHPAVG